MSLRGSWLEEEGAKQKLITIKVVNVWGGRSTTTHAVRMTDKMQAFMDACCGKVFEAGTGVFVYHGRRLRGSETPADLDMEDGDEIYLFMHTGVPKVITLKVLDQKDRRITHRMRMTDKFQDVMDKYYAAAPEVTYGTGTFLLDGDIRLRGSMTPADLHELEDGDEIDFFPFSDGGGRSDGAF
ncbi:hypothetical protein ACP4OV_018956 [Aristida adscensionis]